MGNTTELRRVKPGWMADVWRRLNWLCLGTLAAVLLCLIPLLGWAMGLGVFAVTLWNVFGPRPVLVEGDCPACTKLLAIEPKHDDVIACPTCSSVIKVQPNNLVLMPVSR